MSKLQPAPPRQMNGKAAEEVPGLYEKFYNHLLAFCEQMGLDKELDLVNIMQQFRLLQTASLPLTEYHRWLQAAVDQIYLKLEGGNSLESRVARYIQENFAMDISLSDVAEIFKVNPSYLSRAFSQKHGQGFNAYLTEVRITRARILLEEGQMRVYEVAEAVGIGNPETFSRIFRRVTGKSPRDYLS